MSEMNDEQPVSSGQGTGMCARCGELPASVIDGALALCGGCYHSEVLRQRMRAASQRLTGNLPLDLIHSLERSIWRQITDCECLDE